MCSWRGEREKNRQGLALPGVFIVTDSLVCFSVKCYGVYKKLAGIDVFKMSIFVQKSNVKDLVEAGLFCFTSDR